MKIALFVLALSTTHAMGMSCSSTRLPGWNDMASAPRNGTVIELQSNFGIAVHYEIASWEPQQFQRKYNGWWVDAAPGMSTGYVEENCLSWRPYSGSLTNYTQPDGQTDIQRECAALGLKLKDDGEYCEQAPWWQFWAR